MAKSAKDYIRENDLDGARDRLEKSNGRWHNYWFEVCVEIFNSCVDWAKRYVIDPITQTIVTIDQKIRTTVNIQNGSHTYLIKMFDNRGRHVFTKIGKANDIKERMRVLSREYYVKDGVQIADVEVVKEYPVPNDDCALILESFMRNYFRKKHNYIPNDRFEPFNPDENDLAAFAQYHELAVSNI